MQRRVKILVVALLVVPASALARGAGGGGGPEAVAKLERAAAKFLVRGPSVSSCGDYRPGPIAAWHSLGKQDHVINSMPKRAVSRLASRTWMYSISRVSR
jgi:hypothetical protein